MYNSKLVIHTVLTNTIQWRSLNWISTVPSPNPKQGIKLSSSKAAKVFPIIDMACSYGLRPFPMWCKLRLLNDFEPVWPTKWIQSERNLTKGVSAAQRPCNLPVHSLLFVKSIPTMRLEDSRPERASASVTYKSWNISFSWEVKRHIQSNDFISKAIQYQNDRQQVDKQCSQCSILSNNWILTQSTRPQSSRQIWNSS